MVEAILAAATRAEELRAATLAERERRVASDAQTLRFAELALAAVR
jgi:hypothetical protein